MSNLEQALSVHTNVKPDNTRLYEDGLPFDQDRIRIRIQQCGQTILENMTQIGKDLIWAKCEIGHGGFLAWLESDVGMSPRRATEFMRIAERVLNPATPHARQFLQQASSGSKHKALALLDVTDEEMQEAMEASAFMGRPLDEVEAMSVRELRAALKREKEQHAKAEHVRDQAQERVLDLEVEAQRRAANVQPLTPAQQAGAQAIAAASQFMQAIIGYYDECVAEQDIDPDMLAGLHASANALNRATSDIEIELQRLYEYIEEEAL